MTPDLQLPEADTRLGAKRLAAVEADLSSRHSPIVERDDISDGYGHDTDLEPDLLADRAGDRPARSRLLHGGIELSLRGGGARHMSPEDSRPVLALQSAQLDQVCGLFKLLSDKTRLAILQILCDGELNVTALCRRLKLPQPTVSHHLGLLRMNRVIANRRSGKQVYYSLHARVERAGAQEREPEPELDGASPALRSGERSMGLRIVDAAFSIQILTSRGVAGYSRL